jgi:pimeloyl-ACP methyl ester carboxylesterase
MVIVVALVAAGLLATGGLLVLRSAAVAPELLDPEYGGPPSQFVKLPGGTVARYQDFSADGATANDALLLHGGAVSLESWAPWIEHLRGTRRIVAIDLPGHGLTGATREDDYGVEGMATFVKAMSEALGLQGGFVLAGHSMGGHVAWRFALRHPELVRKLVLIAPAGLAAIGGPQAKAIKLASLLGGSWVLRVAASRARLAGGLKEVFHDPAKVTEPMIDRYWAMSRRDRSVDATIARFRLPSFEPAAIARLNELRMPVLLLWGREDIVFPQGLAQTIVRAVQSARLVTYEDCGHFPHEERPDDTVRDLHTFLEVL